MTGKVSGRDNTPSNQWKPGQSGNPAGKPKGARHKVTRLVEEMLQGEAEALSRKAIELALNGDAPVLRLVLERIAPPRKDAPISFELPPIETAADAKAASSSVLAAVAAGEITPAEGQSVMALLVSHKLIIKATDFEERLTALEARK